MKNLCRALVAVAAVGIGILVMGSPAGADAASSEATFYAHINAVRAGDGKPPLVRDDQADGVARAWSAEMARTGQLSHNPNVKSQVTNWKMLGENVGVGTNVAVVTRALENSPAHRANMVNAAFTHVGVGVVEAGGQVWVTEVFKQARTGTPVAAPTAPAPPKAVAPKPTTPPRPRTPAPPRAAPKPAAPKASAPMAPVVPTTAAPAPVVEPVPEPAVTAAAPVRRTEPASSRMPTLPTYVLNGFAASLLGTVMYLLRGPLFSRRTFAGI